MAMTVTFSLKTKFGESAITEIFTFEQLNLHENMDNEAREKVINDLFQAWAWNKLNISYSIVIDEG